MNWYDLPLGQMTEPARPITYGVVKPGPEDTDQGIRFVRGGDIREGKIDLDNLRTITEAVSRPYARTVLKGGELLISLVGNPGEVAIAPDALVGANIARQAGMIALKPDFDSRYVMYFLKSPMGRAGLFQRTQGAVQQVINLAALKTVKIRFPDFPAQTRIATILSAYDDLIENNARRIILLEEAARQLYKEWFIRFRFPGHEHVRIADGVPEGWNKRCLFDLADATYGHAFKSDLFSGEAIGLPVVRIRDVPNRRSETWTTEEAPENKLLSDGDFLIGMDGDFHMNFWAGGSAWLNQRVVRLSGKGEMSTGLLRNSLEKPITDLNETITGTTVKHLGAKHLKQIHILVPNTSILDQANEFCENIRTLVVNLSVQNARLSNARDLFLPRLMSGAISV